MQKEASCSVLRTVSSSRPPLRHAGGTSFVPAKRPRRFLPLYPVGISVRWQWICCKGSPQVITAHHGDDALDCPPRFPFMTMISSCCAVFQNPSFYHGHTTVDDPATRAGRWCCAGPPRHPPPRFVAIVSIMALYPPPPLMAYDRDPPSSHSDVHQRDGCPADRRRGPSTGRNRGLRERTKAKLPARALLRGVSRHRRPSSLPPAQSAPI